MLLVDNGLTLALWSLAKLGYKVKRYHQVPLEKGIGFSRLRNCLLPLWFMTTCHWKRAIAILSPAAQKSNQEQYCVSACATCLCNHSGVFPRMTERMLLLFLEFYVHARILMVSLSQWELHALFSEGVYKPLVPCFVSW